MDRQPARPSKTSVRSAAASDWPAIWRIFRATVAAGDTYTFAPETSESEAKAAWLFDGTNRHWTFVVESNGEIAGTAILRPNQPGLGDHVANAAWMIAPEVRGRGIGRAFAEDVINRACHLGFRGMQFNAVVATNAPAVELWKSLGFRIVGTIPNAFRHATHGLVDLHVIYRDLRRESQSQDPADRA